MRSRQAPYPPGGPGSPLAVKENPGPSLAPPGGAAPARFLWLLGSGRAQPCPTACPCSSVTVMHHVVFGLAAAALARSRASHGSTGPIPESSPGRSASLVRLASGTVRVTRPANPPGAAPPAGLAAGAA